MKRLATLATTGQDKYALRKGNLDFGVANLVYLCTDDRMTHHIPRPGHPERPERLSTVMRHLDRTGQSSLCARPQIRMATDAELLRVHSQTHLSMMQASVARGGGQVESDTWLSAGSEQAARLAAGAVLVATDAVVGGSTKRAICLVRPPGHHARPESPMGFCVYGSVAVGAADAINRHHLNRVLIVDWDVHHGNGTQEMFYDHPQVAFFSIHRHPFYPYTGDKMEAGTGAGLGMTKNLPIKFGTSRREYLTRFKEELGRFADHCRPELIFVSAGFDAHAEDPIGDLGLESEDFDEMTESVIDLANVHAEGRLISVLEGGYNTSILAGCVSNHLSLLMNLK